MKVLKLDPLFTQKDLDGVRAEVGILDGNIMGKKPARGSLKSFGGEQAMKIGSSVGKVSVAQVAEFNDKRYDWFDHTIESDDRDLVNVTNEMANRIAKNDEQSKRRYLNALSAWLRNPITNRKFGSNSPKYVRWKGFDWVMVATGQMFNTIKARLTHV